ncbi:uncharacterized protein DS421_11g328610 [Arachis hypogaea]|nr:uncharacterized protein DS421_11g328610 [Arachis hypogaea]
MPKQSTFFTVLSALKSTGRCLDARQPKKSGKNSRLYTKALNKSKKRGLICCEKSTRCLA